MHFISKPWVDVPLELLNENRNLNEMRGLDLVAMGVEERNVSVDMVEEEEIEVRPMFVLWGNVNGMMLQRFEIMEFGGNDENVEVLGEIPEEILQMHEQFVQAFRELNVNFGN